MKFSPTVAEIADISPMCSIMVAMAIGAITRMAVMSNLQIWKGGSPTQAAVCDWRRNPGWQQPSGFVMPTEVHHKSDYIGNHNAHQDRDDLEHAFSPDVENDD